ncbi:MAG: HEPN domain-containing protein [Candidatus Binatia bacterium]
MSNREAEYRLKLAEGFLEEARQDLQLGRWRSCVDNSQLAAENAAKATLALIGPVSRTHHPAVVLLDALKKGSFPQEADVRVRKIAECAALLGPQVHSESDYGDEANWRTPWELFDETKAKEALELAKEAVRLTQQLIKQEQ